MSAVLWMKSTCTTCRNAKAKLEALGFELEIRDYAKRPLEPEELRRLLPEDPASMLGRRSPAFKALGLEGRTLSREEAIGLMVQDNNLLKRPILVHPSGTLIGFDPAAYDLLVQESL